MKTTLEPYHWKKEYNLDIDLIDNYHKKYLETLNLLIGHINEGSCRDSINIIFHKLTYLAEKFLIDEELFFQQHNYPQLKSHKDSHLHFSERILELHNAYNEGEEKVCRKLLQFLEDWFENHILEYDHEAVRYVKTQMQAGN